MSDTLPPYSTEAERGALSCVLQDPDKLRDLFNAGAHRLWFYGYAEQTIFGALSRLDATGRGIDIITLSGWLKDEGLLEKVGGVAYLSELADVAPSPENLGYYLPDLEDKFRRRGLLDFAARIQSGALDLTADSSALLDDAETSWSALRNGVESAPNARPLGELVNHKRNDPAELLRYRYLCRMGTLLLCGPTGVGKSSLARQFAILWSLGRAAFGIDPAGPLKSLIVQAENDDGDEAEIRDGVFGGLRLSTDECEHAGADVFVTRIDDRTGAEFFRAVRPLLTKYRPDILWIDPALSFLGGDSNAQKDVGTFLRNMLNPLLREFDCGCVIVHHTNKPASGKEKPTWAAGDFAYLGAGSAEWANHARAVLGLRSIGSHEVYELTAGKRGSRLGWRELDGQTKAFAKYLAHAKEPGVICWREADPDGIETGGRPKNLNAEDMLSVLPPEGLTSTDWQSAAKDECGISERSFFRERKALEKAGRILKSKINGKWQPILK